MWQRQVDRCCTTLSTCLRGHRSAARDGCCRARHSNAYEGVGLQVAVVVANRRVLGAET